VKVRISSPALVVGLLVMTMIAAGGCAFSVSASSANILPRSMSAAPSTTYITAAWSASPTAHNGATDYDVQLENGNTLVSARRTRATHTRFGNLTPGTQYRWRLAIGQDSWHLASRWSAFRIVTTKRSSSPIIPTPKPAPAPTSTSRSTSTSTSASCPAVPSGYTTLGSFNIISNVWNQSVESSAAQTLYACAPGSWYVTATMTGNAAGYSYSPVVSFPEVAQEIGKPLGSLATVTSRYASYGPQVPGTSWESAYDLWLNGDPSQGGHEVMMWTDNHGQYPSGSQVSNNVTIDGVRYQLWVQQGGDYETTLVQNANTDSGSVNILDVLKWLSANGYEATDPTLSSVNYGFEICKTNGQPMNFGVTGYGLTIS
jgi:hypothetical protein